MVNMLRQRSLVDKVFVSPYSNVKQGFYKRDLNDQDTLLSELDQVNGNTQGKKLNNNMINQILKKKLLYVVPNTILVAFASDSKVVQAL